MSTETPMTGDWWCPSCKVALDGTRVTYDERCDTCGTPVSVAGEGDIARLERENARLREEVETLNVRHAAAMLHAQTHADEYNALREEVNGLLQDIQRLTEEAFKRDEELSEAKREIDRLNQWADSFTDIHLKERQTGDALVKETMQRAEQAEARALAAEKDAGRYRWLRDSKNAYPLFFIAQRDPHNIVVQFSGELADMNIDAAVAGAKHD